MNESIKQYLSSIGKLGGKVSGGAKAQASRNNGKLGGRPKKNKSQELGGNKARKTDGSSSALTRNTQKSGKMDVPM
jgi:hypothetical protein